MSQEDQEALAAQWAAELENEANADGAVDPMEAAMQAVADAAPDATGAAADAGGEDSKKSSPMDDEALAAQWAEALAGDEEQSSGATFGGAGSGGAFSAQASEAHFQDMTEMSRQPKDNKLKRELDFILDIPLDVSAELGRTRLLINELLQLGQGSVVELNKLAGEPLEVYVNGKLVARGEAVVINEKFGVRLTDIISPIERVKQLG